MEVQEILMRTLLGRMIKTHVSISAGEALTIMQMKNALEAAASVSTRCLQAI